MNRKSQSEYTSKKAQESVAQNKKGFVTKVHEHDGEEETFTNHQVNVQSSGSDEEFRRVPIYTTHNGAAYVPQVGDVVSIGFSTSDTQSPFVANVLYTLDERPPLARAGHIREEYVQENNNNLYVEREPRDHSAGSPNTVRMAVKEDGLADPLARIEIDLSGSEPVLRLTRGEAEQGNTNMGLEMDFGSGEFKLGDGSGYGIVSDGNGNFTWHRKDINKTSGTINW